METRCVETPPEDLNCDYGHSAQPACPLGHCAAVAAGGIAKVTLLLGEGQNPPWHRLGVARAIFVPSHSVAGETKRRTRQVRSVALRRTDGAKPEPSGVLDDRATVKFRGGGRGSGRTSRRPRRVGGSGVSPEEACGRVGRRFRGCGGVPRQSVRPRRPPLQGVRGSPPSKFAAASAAKI